jgi:hypothetical protein
MSVFSKIENYYDLYENLKKYYQSEGNDLINVFINLNIDNNFRKFLMGNLKDDKTVDSVSKGIFRNIRNTALISDIQKYHFSNEKMSRDTYMNSNTSFAGFYVPFLNYCIKNHIFINVIPTNKTSNDIRIFLLKDYHAVVCANNWYPNDFIDKLTHEESEMLISKNSVHAQYSSAVDKDDFIAPSENKILNIRGSAEWCVKAADYYSEYKSGKHLDGEDVEDSKKHSQIDFLLILDNSVSAFNGNSQNSEGVYLTRVITNFDTKECYLAYEFMNWSDDNSSSNSLSTTLKSVWNDIFNTRVLDDDNNKDVSEKYITRKKLYNAIYNNNTISQDKKPNDLAESFDFIYQDDYFKINLIEKTEDILNEFISNYSQIIINNLKNLERQLAMSDVFEYIFNFITENILDNEKIRLFSILLKDDELGVNINLFNINEMFLNKNFSKFIETVMMGLDTVANFDYDYEILNQIILKNNTENTGDEISKISNDISILQKINQERINIEIEQTLTKENILKIIDELYFMNFFVLNQNEIKEYFKDNFEEKILKIKLNIHNAINKLSNQKINSNKKSNNFMYIINNKFNNYLEKNQKILKNVILKNLPNLVVNDFMKNKSPWNEKVSKEYFTNLNQDLNKLYFLIFRNSDNLYNLAAYDIKSDISYFINFTTVIINFFNSYKNDTTNPKKLELCKNIDTLFKNKSILELDILINSLTELNRFPNLMHNILQFYIIKNMLNSKEMIDTKSDNEEINKLKLLTIQQLKFYTKLCESLFNIIGLIKSFLMTENITEFKFIESEIIYYNHDVNENSYEEYLKLFKKINTLYSNILYSREINFKNLNFESAYYDYHNSDLKFLSLNVNLDDLLKSDANFRKKIYQILNIATEKIQDSEKDLKIKEKNKLEQEKKLKANSGDGFFKKLFKRFFEGVEYQRISENKILISESELKKLIKQNLL